MTDNTEKPSTSQSFPPPPPGPPPAQSYTHDAAINPHQGPPHQTQAQQQSQTQYPTSDAQFVPPPTEHPNHYPIPDYNNSSQPYYAPSPGEPTEEEKRGTKVKAWTTKMHHLGAKAAAPINALANKMGSQAFLPSTMDKECEKAATILLSFCKEGAYGKGQRPTTPTEPADGTASRGSRSRSRNRAILRIPQKVLANAVGLAIFTTARIGFQFSAATGSGVLVARLPDGSWSPPSAIQIHTLGAGFLAGVDIYDCVCVINRKEALEAFMHTRVSLGPEVAVAAGPFGAGGKIDVGAGAGQYGKRGDGAGMRKDHDEVPGEALAPSSQPPPTVSEPQNTAAQPVGAISDAPADPTKLHPGKNRPRPAHRRTSSLKALGPVFSYVKSRGFFAGVHVDGTVITERKEANRAFYGDGTVTVEKILRAEGLVARDGELVWPKGAKVLMEALKKAESRPAEAEEEIIVPPTVATPALAEPASGAGGVGDGHVKGQEGDGMVVGGGADVLPAYDGPGTAYPGAGDQKGYTYQ